MKTYWTPEEEMEMPVAYREVKKRQENIDEEDNE
jgi:hypothetical protein